jgi:propionate CoA-transferase
MPFTPAVEGPRPMNEAIFHRAPMGLRERLLDIRIDDRLSYDEASNTVYMNYSGMRVRTEQDIRQIRAAVDRLLGPLGRKVHSIVNYERFSCDDEIFELYVDAVKYVETTYYLNVRRYTSNAFLRHQLGAELAKRELHSQVEPPAPLARPR